MTNELDREKLLLALKGQYRAKNVKPAWGQELSEDAFQLSEICVDSLKTTTVPTQPQVIFIFLIYLYIIVNQ